jgi:hypothetical protein
LLNPSWQSVHSLLSHRRAASFTLGRSSMRFKCAATLRKPEMSMPNRAAQRQHRNKCARGRCENPATWLPNLVS